MPDGKHPAREKVKRERSPLEQPLNMLGPSPFVSVYAPYTGRQLRSAFQRLDRCRDHWDAYYRNHKEHGYKDRHYIAREFVELRNALLSKNRGTLVSFPNNNNDEEGKIILVEIGCGIGNAVVPLLEEFPDAPFVVYGFDISDVAVKLLNQKACANPSILGTRLHAITWDLTKEDGPMPHFLPKPASFATIVFVLSALFPADMPTFVRRVQELVAIGGYLFVRDYATEDATQRRFGGNLLQTPLQASHSHMDTVEERSSRPKSSDSAFPAPSQSFSRDNGTLTHFFTIPELTHLFVEHGFEPICVTVIERETENRKIGKIMSRRFVQGRFRRIK